MGGQEVYLMDLGDPIGPYQIKMRYGRPVRPMRLPKYTVWRGDRCLEEFRRKASAVKWCKKNVDG